MIEKLAFRLFGNLVAPYLGYFDPLEVKLRCARLRLTLHEYLCICCFASLTTFIISMLVGSFFVTFFTLRALFSYTLSIIISFVTSGLVFLLLYWYPSLKAKSIQARIDHSLPFAIAYMATTASSGINPAEIFKMLSLRGGAIGEEAERIYRDVKMLGTDISSALAKAANRTESVVWSELLWGMLSSIKTGGDLGAYLSEKERESMGQYRRTLRDYSNQVNFYTEIYITLIIIGTLFFIVLSSIMSPLVGGDILLIQTFLVFFFVPLVSLGFIVLLKNLAPSE